MLSLARALVTATWIAASGSEPQPPPSTYDLTPHVDDGLAALGNLDAADHALWSHVGRTLVALGAVVLLIYLLARVVLPRFASRFGGGKGAIRILERVAIDQKHSLVLVQVGGALTFLVGTGDSGVQLVAELSDAGAGSGGFAQVLEQSRTAQSADADPESNDVAPAGGKRARSN
jgi:flagellar biogenesis protein FliO